MDWENHLEKNPIQKIEKKTVKIKVKLPHVNKTTSEKAIFCSNTVFSLYFKFRAKKFYAATPLAFSLYLLFRRDQNHYSNLTSKIMNVWTDLKKKHSRKNSGNDTKEKSAHNIDYTTNNWNNYCEPWTSTNAIKIKE